MATAECGLRTFDPGLWARYTTMLLGPWFFMSGLIWHQAVAVGSLDWILGLLLGAQDS
ncbi:MAG: hypothetical protein ACXWLS_11940 [Myxococcaceae bacterium]